MKGQKGPALMYRSLGTPLQQHHWRLHEGQEEFFLGEPIYVSKESLSSMDVFFLRSW